MLKHSGSSFNFNRLSCRRIKQETKTRTSYMITIIKVTTAFSVWLSVNSLTYVRKMTYLLTICMTFEFRQKNSIISTVQF